MDSSIRLHMDSERSSWPFVSKAKELLLEVATAVKSGTIIYVHPVNSPSSSPWSTLRVSQFSHYSAVPHLKELLCPSGAAVPVLTRAGRRTQYTAGHASAIPASPHSMDNAALN